MGASKKRLTSLSSPVLGLRERRSERIQRARQPRLVRSCGPGRFDHVGITVSDLDKAAEFFVGLGLEVAGRMPMEGEFVDTVIGIPNSRSEVGIRNVAIFGVVRSGRAAAAPFAVAAYIGGAYWFTASTSFANPAVTVARELSNTFAGTAPGSVVPFVIAQLLGAAAALGAVKTLYPDIAAAASRVVIPHHEASGDS